jgi:DNA-binding MarR family transcriptional regulator
MTFIDAHPLKGAFLVNRLERLAELIVRQGETLLQDGGVEFPPRAASTVLLIGDRGAMSVADIAKALSQPHQLATQRVERLLELGIVERVPDPFDGRRWTLRLTRKGVDQFRRLKLRLVQTVDVFAALFEEIACDLDAAIARASRALEETSLTHRVKPTEPVRRVRQR